MSIRKQLVVIVCTTLIFATCALIGLVQTSKGARFHHLNSLHLRHVIELRDLMSQYPDRMPPVREVRVIVDGIRDQPMECLSLIRPWDRVAMRAIGTSAAIDLCVADAAIADKTISDLKDFENRRIDSLRMLSLLRAALVEFQDHSDHFGAPVGRTVEITNRATLIVVPILAAFAIAVMIALARRINSIVLENDETTNALIESEKRNRELAHFDSLTGLPNRNLFADRLQRALGRARRRGELVGLMFIDLDRFKNVNDSFGHEAGDRLIAQAALRIVGALRHTDTVARFGGDEFVTIIEGITYIEGLELSAQKVVDALKPPFKIANANAYVTASIGISVSPDDTADPPTLLKNADIAMYEAKSKGKNRFEFYSAHLEEVTQERQRVESDLRCAIEQDEFEVHYQPIVRLSDMKLCGVEALLRWNHASRGLVPPSTFIPIAEETGQILEIGDWVLERSVEQCAAWQADAHPDFHVAVNVSGSQLIEPGFASRVQDILSRHNVSAGAIDLEITESLTLTENPLSVKTLNELSEVGVRLLMDDFGTGYSCLAYLHQLPFDILKIDGSFMRDSQSNPIVATVIAMAEAFNMSVVAEGIETLETLTFLQGRHCQFAQGYLFDRPMAADRIDLRRSYAAIEWADAEQD